MGDQQIRRVRIRVTGHVQGVGFRYSARSVGAMLGVEVNARNLVDRSVMIDAWGPANGIAQLIDWTKQGPPAARVDRITVDELTGGDHQ